MNKDNPEVDNAPWWDAISRRELTFQTCKECDASVFFPRSRCPHCFSDRLEWRKSAGEGTVYAFTIVRRAPRGFQDRVPYCVALIDVKEGFRMMSNVVDCKPEDIRVGMPVAVDFELRGDGLLPVFKPSGTGGS